MLQLIGKTFAERAKVTLSGLVNRDVACEFTSIDSVKPADLTASLPAPGSVAVVRLKPLAGQALGFRRAGPAARSDGWILRRLGERRGRRPSGGRTRHAAVSGADLAQCQRRFHRRVDAGIPARDRARQAGNESAAAAAGRSAGLADRREIHRRIRIDRSGRIDWLLPDSLLAPLREALASDGAKAPAAQAGAMGARARAPRCKRRKSRLARSSRKPRSACANWCA